MSKRFTDTDKWKKAWFRALSPKLKCAWQFLCDQCDHAGIWEIDIELMSFHIGENVTLEELQHHFKTELISDNKLFLRTFVLFQYGHLDEKCKAHQGVIRLLKKYDLMQRVSKGLRNPYKRVSKLNHTLSVRVQDKDKDKDKELKGGSGGKEKFDFKSLYAKYPLKVGKKKGLERCKADIKTQEQFDSLSGAIDRYASHIRGTEAKYIKHFSTFMNCWEDWIEPDAGTGIASSGIDWDEVKRLVEAQEAQNEP